MGADRSTCSSSIFGRRLSQSRGLWPPRPGGGWQTLSLAAATGIFPHRGCGAGSPHCQSVRRSRARGPPSSPDVPPNIILLFATRLFGLVSSLPLVVVRSEASRGRDESSSSPGPLVGHLGASRPRSRQRKACRASGQSQSYASGRSACRSGVAQEACRGPGKQCPLLIMLSKGLDAVPGSPEPGNRFV